VEQSQDVKPKLDIVANHLQAYNFRANGFDISVRSTHSHLSARQRSHGTNYFS
jgi:hypothetical protein